MAEVSRHHGTQAVDVFGAGVPAPLETDDGQHIAIPFPVDILMFGPHPRPGRRSRRSFQPLTIAEAAVNCRLFVQFASWARIPVCLGDLAKCRKRSAAGFGNSGGGVGKKKPGRNSAPGTLPHRDSISTAKSNICSITSRLFLLPAIRPAQKQLRATFSRPRRRRWPAFRGTCLGRRDRGQSGCS